MNSSSTILLAEDYDDDVILLRRALSRAQVEHLQVVRNGDEALEYLRGEGIYADREKYPFPSLLLIDIKMPRRSGLEVLRWVREQDSLKGLPVVVLTSSHNLKDVNEAHELGANSYLVKPTSFQELVRLMQGFAEYWLTMCKLPVVNSTP